MLYLPYHIFSSVFLAEVSAGVSGTKTVITPAPWWYVVLSNGLALTILFIFAAAVISVLLSQRRRDKCLKLFHKWDVTYLSADGQSMWGKLKTYSQGVELEFSKSHITRRNLTKSGELVYEAKMTSALALCRVTSDLNKKAKRRHRRQIRKTFHPGIVRRILRWFRNLISTLKDAFSKALTAIIGTLVKTTRAGEAVSAQQAQVQEIGQTVLGAAANSYEPILEAHIGKPVILDITSTAEPTNKLTQIQGYLADYTSGYVGVFNIGHSPKQRINLEIANNYQQDNFKVEFVENDAVITCTGEDALIIKQAQTGTIDLPDISKPHEQEADDDSNSYTETPFTQQEESQEGNLEIDTKNQDPELIEQSDPENKLEQTQEEPQFSPRIDIEDLQTDCAGREIIDETDLSVVLLNGCQFKKRINKQCSLKLLIEITDKIDIVAPRTIATVNFTA